MTFKLCVVYYDHRRTDGLSLSLCKSVNSDSFFIYTHIITILQLAISSITF